MTCPSGFHPPRAMKRDNASAHFHTRSWSYRHICPTCGKAQRRNSNFLGSRFHLVCDGQKVTRVRKDEAVEYTVIVGNARGAVEVTMHNYPDDGERTRLELANAMIDSEMAKDSVIIKPKARTPTSSEADPR